MLRTVRRPSARKAAASTVLTLALAASLSGCALGFNSGTSAQLASGNGANANLGDLQIRDITLVQGPAGSGTATLIGTIVNGGAQDDALVSVAVADPKATGIIGGTGAVGGTLPLPGYATTSPAKGSSTRIGFNSEDHVDFTGVDVAPSRYVDLTLTFQTSGQQQLRVMVVPAEGRYAGIAPLTS